MSLPTHFSLAAADGKTIQIPVVGYGTWASGDKSWCKDAVLKALKAGYRHVDCAWKYGVDQQIGEAIRESGVPRSEIFVTSKIWPHFYAPEHVDICVDHILKGMGLDYLDLCLAHWPVALKPISTDALKKATTTATTSKSDNEEEGMLVDENGKEVIDWEHTSAHVAELAGKKGSFIPTWQAMQQLVKKGKARAVGVSNFSITELEELIPYSKEIPLSNNQVEVHPWLPNTDLIEFSKKHGILTSCYSPFAGQQEDGRTLFKDPTIVKLAEKNKMDAGQLLQSWAVQRGTSPLGKSATESRIKSNLEVHKLSDEDMQALDGMDQGESGRTIDLGPMWGLKFYVN